MRLHPTLLALPVAFLTACGGGGGDEDTIRDIVNEGSNDPTSICENLTKDGLEQIGGEEACKKLAEAEDNTDPDVKINSVEVDGDKATAKVTGKDGDQTINFVKEDGEWRVSPG